MPRLFRFFIASSLVNSAALAQSSPSVLVAGWGYTAPGAIQAAPGQIVTVSLYGLPARTVEPLHVYDEAGRYTTLNSGISVVLVQPFEPTEMPVAIYAVQQTTCAETDRACSPLTVLTLRLPFELTVSPVPGQICPKSVRRA
jgi:hypothetical protein